MTEAQIERVVRRLRELASRPRDFRSPHWGLLSVGEIFRRLASIPSAAEFNRLVRSPEVRQRLLRALAPSGSRCPGLPQTDTPPPAGGSTPQPTDQ